MVTPEMLLFLAGKMGLLEPCICGGVVDYVESECHGLKNYADFTPHTNPAQFGRLVVWAAPGRYALDFSNPGEVWCLGMCEYHDSTPDSIRAAVVVAVCRALGWEEGKE